MKVDKRKLYGTIIGGIAFLAVILAFTYARYVWQSEESALSFSITDDYFYCDTGQSETINITKVPNLAPTLDYRTNSFSEVFMVNNVGKAATTFSIGVDISSIDDSLISSDFKYKLVVDKSGGSNNCSSTSVTGCEDVAEGDFSEAEANNVMTLAQVVSLDSNVRYQYYLFIYIDGNASNSAEMMQSEINFTLQVCEIVAFFDYNGGTVSSVGNSIDGKYLKVTDTYDGLPVASHANTVISYNSNGGTSASSQTISYGFGGWYLDETYASNKLREEGDSVVDVEGKKITTNHTLHAKWNPTETSGTSNDGCVVLPTVTRTGYTFNGWYSDSGLTKSVGAAGASYCLTSEDTSRNLYAKWMANKYTITLDGNGATTAGTSSVTATYDSSTISPSSITLPQRKFVVSGFATADSRNSTGATISSTSDITATSGLNGFYTAASGGSRVIMTSGTNLTFDGTVSGYISDSKWVRASNTTLYAQWTDNSITLPTIVKPGYNCGWTTSSTGTTKEYASGASIKPTANTTIYAVCEANSYTVTADAQTGTIPTTSGWTVASGSATATKSVTYNSTYGTLPTPTKTGYTFNGWQLVPNEYQQVDYIQTTGGEYIATGVTGTARWEFDIQFTDTTTRQLMGYGGSGSEYWGIAEGGSNAGAGKYGLATWQYMSIAAGNRDTVIHNYGENSKYFLNVNGTQLGVGVTDVSAKEYGLFNLGSGSEGYPVKAKLYRLKTIQNGALIRDFVPCYRKSDGVVGLYDRVNNKFYTNSGSGSFTYGSVTYVTSSTTVLSPATHKIYASWTVNQYTITLDGNGATTAGTSSVTATYGSSVIAPSSITLPKKVYTVSGFATASSRKSDNATVSSTSNLTSTYTFNGWYTATSSGSKVMSNSATPAYVASVSGYTNASSQWVRASNTTLYAQWTSKAVTLPTVEKPGYTCGWTTSSTGTTITYNSGASFTPTAATTMYAVCVGKSYTVTADAQTGTIPSTSGWTVASGSATATKSVTMGSTYSTLPTPTKTGYTLNGWQLVPNEYQQVDYIQSSGTQYIDTGFIPNNNTRIILDFKNTGSTLTTLYGARADSSSAVFGMWIEGATVYPHYGNVSYNTIPISVTASTRYIYDMNKNVITVNGTTKTATSVTFDSGYNLTILAMNSKGTIDSRMAVGNLYSVKIYDNGTLVRNLIPCYRKSDSVVGMYDIANNKFYTNAGSGSFTYGSVAYITSSSTVEVPSNHKIYANWADKTAPTISTVSSSTDYDIRNYVSFTATDSGSGISGYNITTNTTAPTTWIPVVNAVETTTETKYAYSTAWARVFHHNTHYGTVLYNDATEAKSSNTTAKYSVLGNMANYANSSGVYEMLLEFPGVSGYNRWKQSSNPVTTSESVTGYTAVSTSWTGNYWGGLALSNSSSTLIDGSINHSNRYYAIGSYTAWNGGIPGPNDTMVSHVNLWNRIDDKTATSPTTALTRRIGDLSSNGTYYVWVKDSAGNKTSKSVSVSKVDTTAPTVSMTESSDWVLTLTSSDNIGITKYYFGTTNPSTNVVTWSSTMDTTKTLTSGGTYYFAAQDAAGNIAVTSVVVKNKYTVTLNKGTGISAVSGAGTYKEGTSVTIDATVTNGYTWSSWSGTYSTTTKQYTFTMPSSNVTLTANATINQYDILFSGNGGTISSGKTLTNMVTNGSFENGSSGWTLSGASVVSGQKYTGSYALQLNSGTTAMSDQTMSVTAPTLNHKYYGRTMFLSSSNFTFADNRFEWYNNDNSGGTLVFANKNDKTTSWKIKSSILTQTSSTYLSNSWHIRNFIVSGSTASYVDDVMIMDLTNTFGSGSEIVNTTLFDKLAYFDGSISVSAKENINYGTAIGTLPTVTRTGYTFNGWYTAPTGGTKITTTTSITDDQVYYAQWNAIPYTNTVNHVIYGDNPYIEYNFGSTTFTKNYGTSWTFNSSLATTVPNGTTLHHFGTADIAGSWTGYDLGATATQPAKAIGMNAYYVANEYTITYNMNGGTNNSSNPSTYTVLYGVTLQNPTRTGYTFAGWTDANGNPVTGINAGATADFTSGSDMYTKLSSRTTGNITLTANWTAIDYTLTLNKGTGIEDIDVFLLSYGSGILMENYDVNTFHYGDTIEIIAFSEKGYTWSSWTGTYSTTEMDYTFTMPAANVTMTANAADTVAPTIDVFNTLGSTDGPSYTGGWTNQSIYSVITFSDAGSGIKASTLAWGNDGSTWTAISNSSTSTFTDTWSGEGNRKGYYKICDNAGNCAQTAPAGSGFDVMIDKTAPTAPTAMEFVFGDWTRYTQGNWTNQSVYAGSASDSPGPSGSTDAGSGVAKYQISLGDNIWVDYSYAYSANDTIYSMHSSRVHNRYFRAVDYAGNFSTSIKRSAWIDKTVPSISSISASTVYDVRNFVSFTATDSASGINGYNISTSTTTPTTWIPVVNAVETTTETSYAYGAAWARVFHHNTHYGSVLYSDANEAKSSNTVDKYSVLGNMANYANSSGVYEMLLEYPGVSGYNRWKQSSNPVTTSESVTGYTAVSTSWTDNYWGGLALSNSNATLIDGSINHLNWWYAIGAYNAHQGAIPGGNDTVVSHVNLWNRIDDKTGVTTTSALTRRVGDISSNGTYYLWVKDSVGNATYNSVSVSKVDTTEPTVSITRNGASSANLSFTDNVGVTKYYFGTTDPTSNSVTWTATTSTSATSSITANQTYYLAAQDAAGNRKVTSLFFPITYTVTYNCNGGTGGTSVSATYNTALTLNNGSTCSRSGFTFAYWTTAASGGTQYNGSASVSNLTSTNGSTVTLYAQWYTNNYAIKNTSGTILTYRTTLGQSIAASAAGYTIQLLKNLSDTYDATVDKNLTLNLGGYTLTRNKSIVVNSGKTLTMTGSGTVTDTTNYTFSVYGTLNVSTGFTGTIGGANHTLVGWDGSAITVSGGTITSSSSYTIVNHQSLTINGSANVTNTSSNDNSYSIYNGNGSYTDAATSISGSAKITSSSAGGAVYSYYGSITVAGYAKLTAYSNCGISSNNNTSVAIKGSTSSLTGSSFGICHNGTGTLTIEGGTIAATSEVGVRNYATATVTISGGTIRSQSSHAVYNRSTGTVTITGGTFVSSSSGYATIRNGESNTHAIMTIRNADIDSASHRGVTNNGGDLRIYSGTIINASKVGVYNTGTYAVSGSNYWGRSYIGMGLVTSSTASGAWSDAASKSIHVGYASDKLVNTVGGVNSTGTNAPMVTGNTYGVYMSGSNTSILNNGIIRGKTAGATAKPTTNRSGYKPTAGDGTTYKRYYLKAK